MNHLPLSIRLMLPFLVVGLLSFQFSVRPYFVQGGRIAGTFVGLWVPWIHSLGTLLLSPVEAPAVRERHEAMS